MWRVFRLMILALFSSISFGKNLDASWWKHSQLYEVYVRSFKDSNGDGVGDLNGITSKLDHFVELGIDSLWLTPFYKSPMVDMGYDISNYTDVDSMFGTMADFDQLMRQILKKGLKLVIDFVINHTSDKHPWFLKSVEGIKPYDEYYVWKDPKGFNNKSQPIVPNNWQCFIGGSSWTWNEKRKQFYYHVFHTKQPDLNLRSKFVKQEIKDIIRFWFNKGVHGLRMDAISFYMEDTLFRDEPQKNPHVVNPTITYWNLNHTYTYDIWDTYEYMHELREFVDDFNDKNGGCERILIAEAYGKFDDVTGKLDDVMAYYGNSTYKITHYPFNFDFIKKLDYFDSASLNKIITNWMENMPAGATPNWVVENHDMIRLSGKLSGEYRDIFMMLITMLPGIAVIYYGQEIGMTSGLVRPDQHQDTFYFFPDGPSVFQRRDYERTPMQWDDSVNAGFSSKLQPWLPVNPNYWELNVKLQKNRKNSHYSMFKRLSELRKSKIIRHGGFQSFIISKWVYAFTRSLPGYGKYVILFNLGTEIEIVDLHIELSDLPPTQKVEASSINSGYKQGDIVRGTSKFPKLLVLRPLSSLVLSTK